MGAEYQLIKDIQYAYNADVGLAYASPVRGVWNIVHVGTLVPQAHQVYVCPTSCLRGVVLTTAEMGAMDKLSTITVGEDNLIDGDMEEALQTGVERIIAELPVRPRMMMIFTSCVHHFLAVNYRRVYNVLREKYPDIDFVDCYMDPIMRRTAPVGPSLLRQMTRVQKKIEKNPKQVSYVGNCFHPDIHCDLSILLEERGITIKDVNTSKTYDDYLSMAASPVNFLFHNMAIPAAKDMKIRLDQDWMQLRPGYNYEAIREDLEKALDMAGVQAPQSDWFVQQTQMTEEAVSAAKQAISDTPIALDYTAVDRPLELALFLLRHGFNVQRVYIDVFTEAEEVFDALRQEAPQLRIYPSLNWNILKMDRDTKGKILCIGQKAAYFNSSDYFVNLVDNEGLYGFAGIRHLMELMVEANEQTKPMKELVQVKGWGCSC